MNGPQPLRPHWATALAVGLVAVVLANLPPVELAQTADRWFYDQWSRLPAPSAPEDIVLVRLKDPAWQTALLALAGQQNARLVVSTLPRPPAGNIGPSVLGPTVVPTASRPLVFHETGWPNGGHLLFQPDVDGVVRHDWPVIDDAATTPSLAFSSAGALLGNHLPHRMNATLVTLGSREFPVDTQGRRWLRFYGAQAFEEFTPSELIEQPDLLGERIVIAGQDSDARHRTPLGPMSARALVAHALAGYWRGHGVLTGAVGVGVGWSLTALALVVLLAFASSSAGRLAATGLAAGGALGASAALFTFAGVWVPIGGPILAILAGGGAAAWTARHRSQARPERSSPPGLIEARRLAARGELAEAWRRYQEVPVTSAILPELYSLGCALEAEGATELATNVFHQIAQVDSGYRDVTHRLISQNTSRSAAKHGASETSQRAPLLNGSIPRVLGRYELLEEIGQGAMGVVYLGRDPKINRVVAIKAIDFADEFEPEYLEQARERFKREAETAGRLNHPEIVTIYDVGEVNELAYIAMEFVQGRHLSDYAEPDTLLPVPKVLELLARTADALDYAHRQNVVHRDIKPANIMYDSGSDGLKITDFGIARLTDVNRTRTGIVLGTPSFMSPEQLEGKNVNGHTDLFALGVSLYQLLTGHLPFRGASMTQLMFVIANEPHQPVAALRADLPPFLDPIIDIALAKDPSARFGSGAKMARALRGAASQIG